LFVSYILQLPILIPSQPSSPSADDDPSRHSRTDPKLNHDATLIAYVRQRDLWITSIEGDMRLTFCADQTADRTRSCGTVEYLMQEEFHRYTGYDWGPPLASSADTCIQRILYLETTEADVDVVVIKNASPSCHHPSNRPSDAVDSVRYPRAGRHNAVSDLCIVEFIPHQQRSLVHRKLDIRAYFPWTEYIVRFGWMPHGHRYVLPTGEYYALDMLSWDII
ncbi:dipeptidyl peptidase IV N-terminal region-domain-containing protein, partial [Syncephalastrum racemosum]